MKGNKDVITRLNEALKLELGAVNQYWLHFRLLDNWGYKKLAKKERKELIEEMHHADKLIDRIIFLDGHPNLQHVAPLMIGENLKEVLECDLKGENIARDHYKKSREICRDLGDYVTMMLFEELLEGRGRPHRFPRDGARSARPHRRAELRPAECPERRRRRRSLITDIVILERTSLRDRSGIQRKTSMILSLRRFLRWIPGPRTRARPRMTTACGAALPPAEQAFDVGEF